MTISKQAADLKLKLECFLQEHHVATLATAADDNIWAAAVFYVSEGSTLYFLSSPASRHCKNLTSNARIALTIQKDYDDWPAIRGIQLEGLAGEVIGAEAELVRSLYAQKFPLIDKTSKAPAPLAQALSKVRWYKVVPTKLYFIDNTVGFGHRDELVL